METIMNISLGIFHGLWDSIKGMTLVFYIDHDIHKLNQEKLAERQRRMELRRSPSPIPISAAAMAEQHPRLPIEKENPDERRMENIRRKQEPSVEKPPKGEAKIAKQVFKCCILNGGFTWASIIFFEQLLLPTLKFVLTLCYGEHKEELYYVWGWLATILSIIFGMMWVLPIFLLSKIVSSLWFADIANAAYRVRKGRPQMIPSISKLIADFLFSLLVQALFLVQSMLVNLVPIRYVGSSLCFLHLCLLYSLYCFEYKWFNMGWELHRRLAYIENNWPYFLGFGIPLTVLTNATSSVIVSSCIFSIFFPLFILSGNEAKPIVGTTGTPMRLFSPVIFVSNLFFNRSPRGQRFQIPKPTTPQQQQQLLQQQALLRQQLQQQQEHREYRMQQQQQQELKKRHHAAATSRESHSSSLSARSTPERERFMRNIGMRPTLPPPLTPTLAPGAPGPNAASARSVHHR